MSAYLKNSKGFTLLELLVVTAILGILASIAFALLNPAVLFGQARDTRRKADLQQFANSLQLFYNDHKCYPSVAGLSTTEGWAKVSDVAAASDPFSCQYQWVPSYTKSVPNDPTVAESYQYFEPGGDHGCGPNQYFVLRAKLERPAPTDRVWCDGTNLGDNNYTYVTAN